LEGRVDAKRNKFVGTPVSMEEVHKELGHPSTWGKAVEKTVIPMHLCLARILYERGYERREVILASGQKSDFFIDCKQAVLTAEGHFLTGLLMLQAVRGLDGVTVVAGVELGGCPLASAVSAQSARGGERLDAVYVRKEVKDHGTRKSVEGDRSMPAGTRVALLEDVVTTGGSTLRAISKLESAGAVVAGVIVLVDRQEGGREAIEAAGYKVVPLITKDEILAFEGP
jgi:orotate phosphoribosyltransferase